MCRAVHILCSLSLVGFAKGQSKGMQYVRSLCAVFVSITLSASSALGAIVVQTSVTTDRGIRAQAVITDPNGYNEGGGGVIAVAVKEVHSAIFIIDNIDSRGGEGGGGLTVTKRNLSPAEAYGLGLPFGYTSPPTTDPAGPWEGLVWPYRDQYDYYPDPFDPLGDDVGTPFFIFPDVYGFVDVDAIARGGPTDPVPAGADPNLLLRGITGNGLLGPATYFNFDVVSNFGDPERLIELRVISASAVVVVQDQTSGQYSEIVVPIDPFSTFIRLPEPSLAGSALLTGFVLVRRRRAA